MNKQEFLISVVTKFVQISGKSQKDIEQIYEGYKRLISNQLGKSDELDYRSKQQLEILEKVYTMFKDTNFRKIVVDNNVTQNQIVMMYGEFLIGDNKRKYNMSDRFNPGMIASENGRPGDKKVIYIPGEKVKNSYLDSEGKKVIIQEIGKLDFQEWNGVYSNIYKYKILKQLADGSYQENEVFSYIIIADMQKTQYREAVLGELLSENNIQLSKAGGYIGKIRDISNNDSNDFKIGSERNISTNYFYRVNSKYALEYNSEELSAAMIQEQIAKEQQSRKGEPNKVNYSRNTNKRSEKYKRNFKGTGEGRE